jgi:hypothetical protein
MVWPPKCRHSGLASSGVDTIWASSICELDRMSPSEADCRGPEERIDPGLAGALRGPAIRMDDLHRRQGSSYIQLQRSAPGRLKANRGWRIQGEQAWHALHYRLLWRSCQGAVASGRVPFRPAGAISSGARGLFRNESLSVRVGLDLGWAMAQAHSPLRPVRRIWMRRAATSASSSLRTK